jgi:DNA-binding response OmpR family regulator
MAKGHHAWRGLLLGFKFARRDLGWDYLQKLKRHRGTMAIPVILCTAALNDVREQESVLLQKGIPILYKPFHIDELLALVQQQVAHVSSWLGKSGEMLAPD